MNADLALAKSLPELRAAEQALRAAAARERITYEIADFGGFRTEADTTKILGYREVEYAQYVAAAKKAGRVPLPINKWRPIAPFGRSYHDYGAAFDVRVTGTPPGMTAAQGLSHLGALSASVGLRWGASFNDPAHFELPITLDDARQRWAKLASGAASLGALVMPGISVIGSAGPTIADATARPHIASIARSPLAVATIGTGAVVAAALLTWLVVRRFTE